MAYTAKDAVQTFFGLYQSKNKKILALFLKLAIEDWF